MVEQIDRIRSTEKKILNDYLNAQPMTPARMRFAHDYLMPDPQVESHRSFCRGLFEKADSIEAARLARIDLLKSQHA